VRNCAGRFSQPDMFQANGHRMTLRNTSAGEFDLLEGREKKTENETLTIHIHICILYTSRAYIYIHKHIIIHRRVKPVLYIYYPIPPLSVREGRTPLSDVSGSVCGTSSSPRDPLQSLCIYIR